MAKTKAELAEFWKQNDGKLIKGYGKWLIAYGILVALACIFWIFYIVTQLKGAELTGLGIAVLTFYFATLCSAIYYGYAGEGIVKGKFSPSKIQSVSTAVIALVVITAICQLILSFQLGGSSIMVFGLLDIVTLIDSFRYKSSWHKSYQDFCDGKVAIAHKVTPDAKSSKPSKSTKRTKIDDGVEADEDFFDGL